jgi:signal transduction histidine kinase
MARARESDLVRILLLAVAYAAAARLSLLFAFANMSVSPLWLPSGIALASLMAAGLRIWPGVFLGAFVANLITPVPVPVAFCISVGNTLAAVVAASVVARMRGLLDRPAGVVGFVLGGAMVPCLIAALIGVGALWAGGQAPSDQLAYLGLTWWLGDSAGDVIFAPFLLALREAPWPHWDRRKRVEALALLILLAAITWMCFGPTPISKDPLGYLPVPVVVWLALRFEHLGATSAIVVLTAISNWGTVHGYGPFAGPDLNRSLLLLELFIGEMAVATLIQAAVIGQRRLALASLMQSHSLLEAQAQGSIDGILVVGPQNQVIASNRRFQEMWGIPQRIMSSRDDERLLSQVRSMIRDWDAFVDKVRYLYEHPLESSRDELALVDGRTFDRYSTPAIAADGTNHGRVWYFRDITARKQLETTLQSQNEQLIKLDRLKNDFVNVVSHELRTPLTSLVGFAEFLEDGVAGPLQPAQQEYVAMIQENAGRLRMLVDDLLDFSRLQAGTLQLQWVEADMGGLISNVAAALRPQIAAAGLRLDLDLPAGPVIVTMAQERIGQVLMNLLSNAIKFTSRGGQLTVRLQAQDLLVRVEVVDTGIGIAPTDQGRLFERFFQAEPSLTRSHGGVGLGLSISKAIVEAHGGNIGFNSVPQQGSTFWFVLPRQGPSDHLDA